MILKQRLSSWSKLLSSWSNNDPTKIFRQTQNSSWTGINVMLCKTKKYQRWLPDWQIVCRFIKLVSRSLPGRCHSKQAVCRLNNLAQEHPAGPAQWRNGGTTGRLFHVVDPPENFFFLSMDDGFLLLSIDILKTNLFLFPPLPLTLSTVKIDNIFLLF